MSQFKPNSVLLFSEYWEQADTMLKFGKVIVSDTVTVHATITATLPTANGQLFSEISNVSCRVIYTLPSIAGRASYHAVSRSSGKAIAPLPTSKGLISTQEIVTAKANIVALLPTAVAKIAYDSNVWRGLSVLVNLKNECVRYIETITNEHRETAKICSNEHNFYKETASNLQTVIRSDSQMALRISWNNDSWQETANYCNRKFLGVAEDLQLIFSVNRLLVERADYLCDKTRNRFEVLPRTFSKLPILSETANFMSFANFSLLSVAKWLASGLKVGFEVAKILQYNAGKNVQLDDLTQNYSSSTLLNFNCQLVKQNTILHFGKRCQPQDKLLFKYDEVIFVSNSITLVSLTKDAEIKLFSGSIGIDNKSYCWTFDADIAYFETVEKGELLEFTINGHKWRFIVDEVSSSQSFGDTSIKISGKSQALLLSYPFTGHRGYKYTNATSAYQIVQDEINRVGGFSLDWQLIDSHGWLVPQNVYSYTNYTPINAIQDVVSVAGGFVNADMSEKKLIVRSDFPVPAWQWHDLIPDIVIPSSLIWFISHSQSEKPSYNGVWISGDKAGGVMGFVKRQGTDGVATCDQVVHSLITDQSVAIHRGQCELSKAGITTEMQLTTPLHNDIGIVKPSDFVVVMGKNAIVRGVDIRFSASNDGKIDLQNNLRVETK